MQLRRQASATSPELRLLLAMLNRQPTKTTEQIWRELSDRLRLFIRSRVASDADIDDILQAVFLRIHQNLQALRRADRMESWVFQITRNAIVDHFRDQCEAPQEDAAFHAIAEPAREGNALSEIAGCLATLIEELPADQRRAVTMYELDGLSQAAIAQRESISLSGAKSRIQRGRRRLEDILRACCRFQWDRRGNLLEYEALRAECGQDCDKATGCR